MVNKFEHLRTDLHEAFRNEHLAREQNDGSESYKELSSIYAEMSTTNFLYDLEIAEPILRREFGPQPKVATVSGWELDEDYARWAKYGTVAEDACLVHDSLVDCE